MSEIRLKADMALMRAFIELRRTEKLRIVVDQAREVFNLTEKDDDFRSIVDTLEMMEEFEQAYGVGSCINLENPIVERAISDDPSTWKQDHVENARNAPSRERIRIFLAAA